MSSERPPLAVDVAEFGRLISVSPRTAWDLIRRGEVPTVRIGGSRRVLVADIENYLADLRVAGPIGVGLRGEEVLNE